MTFPHTLNVYEKPKMGNGYLGQYPAYNYKHRISAIGGFDSAVCDIVPKTGASVQHFITMFLGNRVAIYVDDPVNATWEGFINRVTFGMGQSAFTVSLDEMINRVVAKYVIPGGTLTNTTAVNTAASQAIYGIKAGTLDLGIVKVVGSSVANLASTKLNNLSWPKSSITRGGSPGVIRLEMLGFYHTLKWEERVTAVSGAAPTLKNLLMQSGATGLLPNLVNGSTFLSNTDFTDIQDNTLTKNLEEFSGKTVWDVMVEVQEIGDASLNYWVIGVTPTNFQSDIRRLYYRPANYAIEYTASARDNLRPRSTGGFLIPPWRVRPDRGILVTDLGIGGAIVGDDPTQTYITSLDYDANSQIVTWTSDDSKNSEAAFQLHRNIKQFGRRFGAAAYRSTTA